LRNRFIKDTAFLWTGSAMTQLCYLLTSVLLARSLGPADLGRYNVADKVYIFCFFIANLGLNNVTIVRYSHATGSKDKEAQTLALAAFVKIYLLMAFAIVVLGFFVCPYAAEHWVRCETVGYYSWALCLMGLIDIMRALAIALLLGARHMKEVARLESAVGLVRVIVLTLAIAGGYGLQGVIFGSVFSALLWSLMGCRFYYLLRRAEGPERPPPFREVLKALPRARMKNFFTLGFFIALNKNLMEIAIIFGSIFLARYSFYDTGQIRIATILMLGLILLLGGVTRNLLPTLGFKLGETKQKDISHMGKTLLKVSLVSGLVFVALTALFLLVVPWVVRFLYGSEYKECVRIIWILSAAHLVWGFGVIIEPFYIYTQRIKLCVAINTILFVLIIPCGYFLAKSFGVVGVAWYLTATRVLLVVHLFYIAVFFLRRRRAVHSSGPSHASADRQ
jgi:O-antigen/teichoic acid export membrane protein